MPAESDGIHSSIKAIQDLEAACARFARTLVERLPDVERELRQVNDTLEDRRSQLRGEIAGLQERLSSGDEDDEDGGQAWERQRLEEAEEELASVQRRIRRLSEAGETYAGQARKVEHLAHSHSIQAREFLDGAADDLRAYLTKSEPEMSSISALVTLESRGAKVELGTSQSSENRPELALIANDPVVKTAIDTAWADSNPHIPGHKLENGFWILRANDSGTFSVRQFPPNTATNSSIAPGIKPNVLGHTTVAFFHTHPNTADEGFTSGPSHSDIQFAHKPIINVPGILRAHDGLHFFGPPLPVGIPECGSKTPQNPNGV